MEGKASRWENRQVVLHGGEKAEAGASDVYLQH